MSEDQHRPAQRRAPERGVLAIIRAIQAGELKPTSLDKREKRQVVEHLVAEGYSVPEAADVLKVSERTITRIRKRVRESNALNADPRRTAQMAGVIVQQAEVAAARFRRIHSDPKSDPSTRLDAARACWQVYREMILALQALGLVDAAPRPSAESWRLQVTPEELDSELQHIRAVAALPPGPSETSPNDIVSPPAAASEPAAPSAPASSSTPFLTTTQPGPTAAKDPPVAAEAGWEITEQILNGPDAPSPSSTDPPPKATSRSRFGPPVQQPLPEAPPPAPPGDVPSGVHGGSEPRIDPAPGP